MAEVRLIDGSELKQKIESDICYGCEIGHVVPPCGRCRVSEVLKFIEDAPTVNAVVKEAQPVKLGHWIKKGLYVECSECPSVYTLDIFQQLIAYGDNLPRHCAYCGAKMDGGDADADC